MYDNWITDQIYFNIIQSDIGIESFDTWINSQTPWWESNLPVQDAIGADAAIYNQQTGTPITADAQIVYYRTSSITANSVLKNEQLDSVTVNAAIESGQVGTPITADAFITCVGQPVWISPADTVQIDPNPVLIFTIPYSYTNAHFEIELDTVNTFSSGDYRLYQTYVDQTNWEYWDGDSWEPFPVGGISNTYAGNNCRLTITSPLSETTWYRRVRGGVAP